MITMDIKWFSLESTKMASEGSYHRHPFPQGVFQGSVDRCVFSSSRDKIVGCRIADIAVVTRVPVTAILDAYHKLY